MYAALHIVNVSLIDGNEIKTEGVSLSLSLSPSTTGQSTGYIDYRLLWQGSITEILLNNCD